MLENKKTDIIDNKNVTIDDWEIYEDGMVKCIYCKKPILIDRFGGIKKEGLFCNDTLCLIELIKEQEEVESVENGNKRRYN